MTNDNTNANGCATKIEAAMGSATDAEREGFEKCLAEWVYDSCATYELGSTLERFYEGLADYYGGRFSYYYHAATAVRCAARAAHEIDDVRESEREEAELCGPEAVTALPAGADGLVDRCANALDALADVMGALFVCAAIDAGRSDGTCGSGAGYVDLAGELERDMGHYAYESFEAAAEEAATEPAEEAATEPAEEAATEPAEEAA